MYEVEEVGCYTLEIETNHHLKIIKRPRKARIVDRIFFDTLQIVDDFGKWHSICRCNVEEETKVIIVNYINSAIKKYKRTIYVDI